MGGARGTPLYAHPPDPSTKRGGGSRAAARLDSLGLGGMGSRAKPINQATEYPHELQGVMRKTQIRIQVVMLGVDGQMERKGLYG